MERNDSEKSGSVILEMLLVIILGSTLGVVMALASSGFVLGVGALGALRGTASAHLPETLQALSPFAPLLTLLLAAGAVLLVRTLWRKATAVSPERGPAISTKGMTSIRAKGTGSTENTTAPPKNRCAVAEAAMEAMEIGAMERQE